MTVDYDYRFEFAQAVKIAHVRFLANTRGRGALVTPDMCDATAELFNATLCWRDVPQCVVCGCTEDNACSEGCWWIADEDGHDRCSQCEGKPIPDRDRDVLELFDRLKPTLGSTKRLGGKSTAAGLALWNLYLAASDLKRALRKEARRVDGT
jgi:hypothetical protein